MPRTRPRAVLGLLVLVLATGSAAGCSGDQAPPARMAASPSQSGPEGYPGLEGTPGLDGSDPSSMPITPSAAPASTAGPLNPGSLPDAQQVGQGWTLRVEGADPEEGVGNGTAFQQRDPAEIVTTTLPMGCLHRSVSPVPDHVLQATYQHSPSGAYAVALRLSFPTDAEAAQFADVRLADLVTCRDQPEDPYSGAPAPVLKVRGGGDEQFATYRLVGESTVWSSGLRVTGSEILTVDSDADPSTLIGWSDLGFTLP